MERVVAAMESSQPSLSIESFSQSWLINFRPSFEDSLVADDPLDETSSFIDLDPKLTPSKRFLSYAHDFSFDSNFSHSPVFLVHADELFSNGLVMPIFINPSKIEASDSIKAPPPEATISELKGSSGALISSHKDGKMEWRFLRSCRRSSKFIFHKYVSFFKPLYQKVQISRRACHRRRAEPIEGICESSFSREVSPRSCSSCSTTDCCDIDEAVLHCKKSFEKGGRFLQRG